MTIPNILIIIFALAEMSNHLVQTKTTILIKGSCYDLDTKTPLDSKIIAIYKENKATLVEKSIQGKFSFLGSDSIDFLLFEYEGYNSMKIPVNLIGSIQGSCEFQIEVPLIAKKKTTTIFQEQNQYVNKENNITKKTQISFEIYDAINNLPLTANVCIINNRNKKRNCEIISTMAPRQFIPIDQYQDLHLEISSDGYETYYLTLKARELTNRDLRCTVRLVRPLNSLSFYLFPSDTLYTNGVLYDMTTKKNRSNQPVSRQTINDIRPGAYELLLQEDKIPIKRAILVKPGLNFVTVAVQKKTPFTQNSKNHTDSGEPNHVEINHEAKQINKKNAIKVFTHTTIYFDQSSYLLKDESKVILDSVAAFLINDRIIKSYITGFTSNVGSRDKNMTLSEYRARVVASYLKNNGVDENQISLAWKGPDFPISSNELNERKKNQRVEIRFATR